MLFCLTCYFASPNLCSCFLLLSFLCSPPPPMSSLYPTRRSGSNFEVHAVFSRQPFRFDDPTGSHWNPEGYLLLAGLQRRPWYKLPWKPCKGHKGAWKYEGTVTIHYTLQPLIMSLIMLAFKQWRLMFLTEHTIRWYAFMFFSVKFKEIQKTFEERLSSCARVAELTL